MLIWLKESYHVVLISEGNIQLLILVVQKVPTIYKQNISSCLELQNKIENQNWHLKATLLILQSTMML
jgi:hypothetical protein